MVSTIWILLLLALLAANLPWFSERLFYVIPLAKKTKAIGWCLLELIVFISSWVQWASMPSAPLWAKSLRKTGNSTQ